MIIDRYASRLRSLLRRPLSIMTSTVAETNAIGSPSMSQPSTSPDLSKVQHVPIPRRGVDYRGKIVLAPMVRSGELPSRLLALHYGADLVWGPETIDQAMIGTTERTNPRTGCIEWLRKNNNGKKVAEVKDDDTVSESIIYRIDPKRESDKLIYQIGTNSPERAVKASLLVAPYVSGIDVNAGCPKPFSTSGGMGAALLRTPDLLASILKALVEEVGKPQEIGISVKIRLLETPEQTSELVHKLCATGIIGLTIHCRTTPMRPRERAIREQLKMIREICHSHGVACLMNGDVASRDDGIKLAAEYGCDGAMIATAAEANSSAFRTEEQGGLAPWPEVVKEYLKYALSVENKWGNTKFLLSQLMPGKDPKYQQIQRARSYLQTLEILSIDDAEMTEQAKALDHLLCLDQPKVTKADIKRAHKQEAKQKREAKLERKRTFEEHHQAPSKKGRNTSRSPESKARIAADNAGFEGIGEGAMAVAV